VRLAEFLNGDLNQKLACLHVRRFLLVANFIKLLYS
jgi:hypothetical protein